jgi:hypothetical protein
MRAMVFKLIEFSGYLDEKIGTKVIDTLLVLGILFMIVFSFFGIFSFYNYQMYSSFFVIMAVIIIFICFFVWKKGNMRVISLIITGQVGIFSIVAICDLLLFYYNIYLMDGNFKLYFFYGGRIFSFSAITVLIMFTLLKKIRNEKDHSIFGI